MTWNCKGVCLHPQYVHKKLVRNITQTPYKKCSTCCIFIKYDGIFCPCCGVRLSNRRKKNNSKDYHEM